LELDALRGIAATLVMLFHYTTRYDQLFGHTTTLPVSVPWGHYGVNLFFMISGFVIFLTLHRINRPMDFVVSRFSRLFPAYWVAIALTFILTHLLQLPGKTVGVDTAILNLFMIHGLFKVGHVDSVYWTLEIELIFYCWALILYLAGRLDRLHAAFASLLLLRAGYFFAETQANIHLPYIISRLLILPYIAWFACGIAIYRLTRLPAADKKSDLFLLVAAIAVLALTEGAFVGLLAIGLSACLWSAAAGRLPILANRTFTWLGAISYTLYLLHENIGWGIILQLQRLGASPPLSIALAIGVVLCLASAVTRLIEQPAMRWLRGRYRNATSEAVAARQ
jgi:peptidoglycan/LPS O-acetylase OafA/YrhL